MGSWFGADTVRGNSVSSGYPGSDSTGLNGGVAWTESTCTEDAMVVPSLGSTDRADACDHGVWGDGAMDDCVVPSCVDVVVGGGLAAAFEGAHPTGDDSSTDWFACPCGISKTFCVVCSGSCCGPDPFIHVEVPGDEIEGSKCGS